jgi:hypothetical protein
MGDELTASAGLVKQISMPTVVLGQELLVGAPQSVSIHADTVIVRGRVTLPELTLSIVARVVDSQDGEIDLSGRAVASAQRDTALADATLNGTEAQSDGRTGAAGERGRDGGVLTLEAKRLVGHLSVRANGSAGGNGQRGGDGARPAAGAPGHDASEFTDSHEKLGTDGAGDYTLYRGAKGGDARPGGNAGSGGRGGDGGRGGRIQVRWVEPAGSRLQLEARGGPPGRAGDAGEPGPAGLPGRGGRNLMTLTSTGSLNFGEGPDTPQTWQWWCRYADDPAARNDAQRFNVAERADNGAPCDKKGQPAGAPPAASAGKDGQAIESRIAAAHIGALYEPVLLEEASQWTLQAISSARDAVGRLVDDGDGEEGERRARDLAQLAIDRYEWLRDLAIAVDPTLASNAEPRIKELQPFAAPPTSTPAAAASSG